MDFVCLVLIAQMCTKCGFCMLGADNSDVYKFRRCKHTAFLLKKSKRDKSGNICCCMETHKCLLFSSFFIEMLGKITSTTTTNVFGRDSVSQY